MNLPHLRKRRESTGANVTRGEKNGRHSCRQEDVCGGIERILITRKGERGRIFYGREGKAVAGHLLQSGSKQMHEVNLFPKNSRGRKKF